MEAQYLPQQRQINAVTGYWPGPALGVVVGCLQRSWANLVVQRAHNASDGAQQTNIGKLTDHHKGGLSKTTATRRVSLLPKEGAAMKKVMVISTAAAQCPVVSAQEVIKASIYCIIITALE
jgi:hypothetical protein